MSDPFRYDPFGNPFRNPHDDTLWPEDERRRGRFDISEGLGGVESQRVRERSQRIARAQTPMQLPERERGPRGGAPEGGPGVTRLANAPGGINSGMRRRSSAFMEPAASIRDRRRGAPTEYRLDQELTSEDIQGFRERAQNAAAGGLRFLASALEPLQLPQDVFFATLEATMDNEKTMLENLKEVEWAKYAPGGATPARVTDGRQILELAGVEDEKTKQWGGLLMDLVVDPLIFGSMATVLGKATKVEGLVNLGRNMDRFVAPSTWGRGAYNRIPQVKNAVDDVTGQVLNALRNPDATLFGLQGGILHKGANAIADLAVSRRTAQQLRLGQFGEELPASLERSQQLGTQRAQDVIASLQDEFPEMFAMMGEDLAPQKLRRITRKLGQYRREEESILDLPQIVRDAMEKEGYDFLRQNPATLTPGIGWTDDVKRLYNEGLPEGARFDPEEALGRTGFTAKQERRIAERQAIYERTKRNQLERAGKSPQEAEQIARRARNRIPEPQRQRVTQRTLDTFDESVEAVRDAARRNGYADSAEKYAQQYRDFVTRLAAKKAEIGYELSGMSMVKEVVAKRGTEIFGSTEEAMRTWSRILHAGVSEGGLDNFLKQSSGIGPNDVNKLTAKGMRQAQDRRRTFDRTLENQQRRAGRTEEEAREIAERRTSAMPEGERDLPAQTAAREVGLERRLGETPEGVRPQGDFTWRELLGDEWEGFSSLDVGAYLAGLKTGHLYRTFGIWQTTEDMSQWARKIESGVIVPNNVIDAPTVRRELTEQGFGEEGRLLEEYIEATTRKAEGRGALVDTRKFGRYVAEQLEQTGVPKAEAGRRARDAIEEITNATSAGRREAGRKIRQDLIPSFERQLAARQRGGPLSKGRFAPRTEFDDETLAIMGEMTQPFVSLAEDAQALQSRLPAMRFMKEVYDQGVTSGAVRKKPFTDTNGVVYQRVKSDADLAKPFTDKYVHPQLVQEIRKAQARQDYTPNRLQHLRSLITGGYLAAPNIMAANLFGGILSSWEGGIPPHKMLSAMARTFRPLLEDGGRHYKPLQELRAREAVSLHGMSVNDLRKNFRGFQMEEVGVGPEGIRKAAKKITDGYEWLLRGGPSATRWAGLDGFQFTEKWMKTSAYLAAKEMAEEAGTAGRAVRGTADEAGQVLRREGDIQNWAAEMARTSVFDYSELPEGLAFARDYGILLFPGFPYFMTTRTIRAVGERPGVVAGTDRVAEAIGSAFTDNEEQQMAMWANMPDWLKEDQGVPVGRWEDRAGDTRMSFIPMNQLLPTNTFGGNPFAESLATGGLYRPFMEAIYAHLEGSGEAVFSQRFGQRVFSPEQGTGDRAMATLGFLYNNLAPALPRKMISPRVGEDAAGILPKLVMPRETVDGLYTFDERQRTRAERGLRDELIGATLRSARVTAQEGPLIGIRNELDSARREHGAKIASLRERIRRAQAAGDRETAQRLVSEMRRMDAEFRAQWSEWLQIAQEPDWQGP